MRRREPTEWWAIDGGGFGYVLDLYPEEAVRYRRSLRRSLGRHAKLLGSFDNPSEAWAYVTRYVEAGGLGGDANIDLGGDGGDHARRFSRTRRNDDRV